MRKGRRGDDEGHGGHRGGTVGRCGGRGSTHRELVKLKFGASLGKRGQRSLALEVGVKVGEWVIEVVEDIDDEEVVENRLPEFDMGVYERLHSMTVVCDGEGALG